MMFVLLWSVRAFAGEELYPCNIEVKRPAAEPGDSGVYYARVQAEDLYADVESPRRFKFFTVVAPANGNWVTMVSALDEFRYRIVDLQFPSSLDRLGVSYRVGFCYQGPFRQSSNPNDPDEDFSQGSYDLVGTLNAGEMIESIPYLGTVSGYCDLREVGVKKTPRSMQEQNPDQLESDIQFIINLGQLESGEIGFEYSINGPVNQVPRFCKVNVEIAEGIGGIRPAKVEVSQPQFTLQIDRNLR